MLMPENRINDETQGYPNGYENTGCPDLLLEVNHIHMVSCTIQYNVCIMIPMYCSSGKQLNLPLLPIADDK